MDTYSSNFFQEVAVVRRFVTKGLYLRLGLAIVQIDNDNESFSNSSIISYPVFLTWRCSLRKLSQIHCHLSLNFRDGDAEGRGNLLGTAPIKCPAGADRLTLSGRYPIEPTGTKLNLS